jgi:hypothetical protein
MKEQSEKKKKKKQKVLAIVSSPSLLSFFLSFFFFKVWYMDADAAHMAVREGGAKETQHAPSDPHGPNLTWMLE